MQAKLLEIHRNTMDVRHQQRAQDLVLALNRSDYMLDEPSRTLMQVSLIANFLSPLLLQLLLVVATEVTPPVVLAAHPFSCFFSLICESVN